jgi:hypothetical protein
MSSNLPHTPMADTLVFVETSVFTRQIVDLLSDEEYQGLQADLMENPAKGDLIQSGGGIRKIRCAAGGKGKSGGIRVIYYWLRADGQIFMLLAYPKSAQDNLTDEQTAVLRNLVKDIANHGNHSI